MEDSRLYICSHWVLKLLEHKPRMHSFSKDVIPWLVRRQFQGSASLPEQVAEGMGGQADDALRQAAPGDNRASGDYDPDTIRCYGLVLPTYQGYCARASTPEAYAAMNRELAFSFHKQVGHIYKPPWTPIQAGAIRNDR